MEVRLSNLTLSLVRLESLTYFLAGVIGSRYTGRGDRPGPVRGHRTSAEVEMRAPRPNGGTGNPTRAAIDHRKRHRPTSVIASVR